MARERRGRSLVEDVYDTVRSDILLGRRLPSSWLQVGKIAEQHGVSLRVVREAVTRLASEDVVEATPRRGFRVRSISLDHLHDLTGVRVQIETLALRRAIAKGDIRASGWDGAMRPSCTATGWGWPRCREQSSSPRRRSCRRVGGPPPINAVAD